MKRLRFFACTVSLIAFTPLTQATSLDCSRLSRADIAYMTRTMTNQALCNQDLLCQGQAQMLRLILAENQQIDSLNAIQITNRAAIAESNGRLLNLAVLEKSFSSSKEEICNH